MTSYLQDNIKLDLDEHSQFPFIEGLHGEIKLQIFKRISIQIQMNIPNFHLLKDYTEKSKMIPQSLSLIQREKYFWKETSNLQENIMLDSSDLSKFFIYYTFKTRNDKSSAVQGFKTYVVFWKKTLNFLKNISDLL